jgi:tetratricopeptide (TPR) repeat protein
VGEVHYLNLRIGIGDDPAVSLRSLRQLAGKSPDEFAAAIADEAGEPLPTSVYMAYEDGEPAPATLMSAARRVTSCVRTTKVPPAAASQISPVEGGADALLPDDEDGSALTGIAADAAAMEGFRVADLRFGGGHIYPTVVRYLQARVAPRLVLLDSAAGNDRAVFTSAAAVSEMAGWMAHDAGLDQEARNHFERALDFVTVSGDRQVTAHVRASIGHLAHHLNDPAEAVRASRAGLAGLARGARNPELEARLLAVEAKGHAALGDADESGRCLSMAWKALAVPQKEPRSEWISGFDEGSLASEHARCMQQLGRLNAAKQHAERVIALRPPTRPRSRAFGLFIHANVLLAAGKPDEASALGAEILDNTETLGSRIIVQQFIDLRHLLRPYRSSVTVRDFLGRLNPALRERLWVRQNFSGGVS